VREGRTIPVPVYLKDGNVRKAAQKSAGGVQGFGAGQSYEYSHDAPNAVSGQDYLGVAKSYYRPTDRGAEKTMQAQLELLRRARQDHP
jgi:putative ATPase